MVVPPVTDRWVAGRSILLLSLSLSVAMMDGHSLTGGAWWCMPQARDAVSLVGAGYVMEDVTPFDLFPQTRHIENVRTRPQTHAGLKA